MRRWWSRSAGPSSQQRRVIELASEQAAIWFPELAPGPVRVRIVRRFERIGASISIVELSTGTDRRLVAAKSIIAAPDALDSPRVDRPRIMDPLDRADVSAVQYLGLELTYQHFSALNDARFGAVRPVELRQDLRTVIMEYVQLPTLRTLLFHRRTADPETLDTLVRNAGAWLRHYHDIDPGVKLPQRIPSPDAFVEAVDAMTAYLGTATRDHAYFDGLAAWMARAASDLGPEVLRPVLAHGDYAPRNVFAGPGQRVVGFDATPRAQGPRLEDVTRFLVGLRTGGTPHLRLRRPLASERLAHLEAAFLEGYGLRDLSGEARRPLDLFTLLALLGRWSSVFAWPGGALRPWRLRALARRRLYDQRFRTEVERITERSSRRREV